MLKTLFILTHRSQKPPLDDKGPVDAMNSYGGDDLDDDFVPDELVALSEPEDAVSGDGEEDVNALLSADEGEAPSLNQKAEEKKRKRRAKEKERKAKVRTVYQLLLNVRYDCRCRNKS